MKKLLLAASLAAPLIALPSTAPVSLQCDTYYANTITIPKNTRIPLATYDDGEAGHEEWIEMVEDEDTTAYDQFLYQGMTAYVLANHFVNVDCQPCDDPERCYKAIWWQGTDHVPSFFVADDGTGEARARFVEDLVVYLACTKCEQNVAPLE